MADLLLQSLRERVLDESEPLAGLLRKCLVLGAETHSAPLRDWARRELNGYDNEDAVPDYRKLGELPIFVTSVSGTTWVSNQAISRYQVPAKARAFLPEEGVIVRDSVEALESLSRLKSMKMMSPGMAFAAAAWSKELGPWEGVHEMHWDIPGAAFAGILGKVRSALVDFVAELTADAPLAELPARDLVDAAFALRIGHLGDVFNTAVNEPSAPVAVGNNATLNGLEVSDVLMLLGRVQREAEDVNREDRAEVLAAVDGLRAAIDSTHPDSEAVKTRAERLKELGARAGTAGLAAATSGVFEAVVSLLAQGFFS